MTVSSTPRAATRRALALAALAWVAACRGPSRGAHDDASNDAEGNDNDPAEREALERARVQTFEAAIEAAGEAFAQDDPLAAAIVLDRELSVPARSLDRLQAIRQALKAARRESTDLDETALSPKQRVNLRVLRFGIDRLEDRLDAHPPARTDPQVAVDGLAATVDELERRLVTGRPVDTRKVLDELSDAARAWRRELVSGSPSTVRDAARRLERLAERTQRIPDVATAASTDAATVKPFVAEANKARDSLLALRAHLNSVGAELSERPLGTYRDPVLVGMENPPRMPERLGHVDLERRLRVEERIAATPRQLLAGVEANLARLDAMANTLPVVDERPAPAPITRERCEAALERIAAWVSLIEPQAGEELTFERPGCPALTAAWSDERLDDAALDLALLQQFVVVPSRRAIRREQHPSVALVSGDLAPWAQLYARSIAYTAPRAPANTNDGRDPAIAHAAFAQADTALCLAGAWLWTHGHDDRTLMPPSANQGQDPSAMDAAADAWLAEHCPRRSPADWRQAASSHPREAARGLGFATFDERPDVMAGIDHFWWAPLGLTYALSHPEAETSETPEPSAPAVKLVPFGGTDGAQAP